MKLVLRTEIEVHGRDWSNAEQSDVLFEVGQATEKIFMSNHVGVSTTKKAQVEEIPEDEW